MHKIGEIDLNTEEQRKPTINTTYNETKIFLIIRTNTKSVHEIKGDGL